MLDHIGLAVADYERSKRFYAAALAPLGYGMLMEVGDEEGSAAGFGPPGRPEFWVGDSREAEGHTHVAFSAGSRAAVDAFYAAAVAAGAKDNGAPGIRPQYHPDYYAAFVYDPDGNNIEAVCHAPG